MKFLSLIACGLVLAAIPIYVHAQEASALSCTTGTPSSSTGLQLIGQPRVVQGPFGITVNGRVQNPATHAVSGIITVTLFDQAGTIVGVYQAAVPAIAASDEVTYTALGTDNPATWAAVEAKVAQQF